MDKENMPVPDCFGKKLRAYHMVLAFIVFALPFFAYFNLILNQFYLSGAPFHDAGWLAAMIWHNNFFLEHPPAINSSMRSFFFIHFTPLLSILSCLSSLWPFGSISYFAAFTATVYAACGLAVFYVLVSGYRLTRPLPAFFSALVATLFSFNGLSLSMAGYPHYEPAISAALMFFIALLLTGRTRSAWFAFIIALLVREDAGLHAFGLLAVLLALSAILRTEKKLPRATPVLLVSGLVYAICAICLQKVYFPGHNALDAVYLGRPPFAHLSPDLLLHRLQMYFENRHYIVYPFLSTFIWASAVRTFWPVAGWIAVTPWFLLSLLAIRHGPSQLWGYYSFPFLLAIFWPLAAPLLSPESQLRGAKRLLNLAGFCLVLLSSTWGWRDCTDCPSFNFRPQVSPHRARTLADFANKLISAGNELGQAVLDQPVVSLAGGLFPPEKKLWGQVYKTLNTIVYHERGQTHDDSRPSVSWLLANQPSSGLCRHYRVSDSGFFISTNLLRNELPSFSPSLQESSPFLAHLKHSDIAAKVDDGFAIDPLASPKPRTALYGPYLPLKRGRYRARYVLKFDSRPQTTGGKDSPIIGIDIVYGGGLTTIKPLSFFSRDNLRQLSHGFAADVEFTVLGDEVSDMEVRLWQAGDKPFLVTDFTITADEACSFQ
ncbi:MAG TPA: hypothetical protein PLP17_00365 [Oligoflexia bacterium]|nr:hypothetical protein [Oligoflexia bacterium]